MEYFHLHSGREGICILEERIESTLRKITGDAELEGAVNI